MFVIFCKCVLVIQECQWSVYDKLPTIITTCKQRTLIKIIIYYCK